MVRNVKVLEGKQYSTRNIRKVIIDEEESEVREDKLVLLKEKNRYSAQKSRDNKKKFITGLEAKISQLEAQNRQLKSQLASCSCGSLQNEKLIQGSTHQNSIDIADIEGAFDDTESGGDTFERQSVRSFVSCGNFLMLAIVMMCCVFGLLQSSGQAHMSQALLFSSDSLQQITLMTKETDFGVPEETIGILKGRLGRAQWAVSESQRRIQNTTSILSEVLGDDLSEVQGDDLQKQLQKI